MTREELIEKATETLDAATKTPDASHALALNSIAGTYLRAAELVGI